MEYEVDANELREVFRANLRARRRELGLTQAQLASQCGMHQPHIAALERGTTIPTLDSLAKLSEALSTNPSALLSAGIFSHAV